MSKNIKWIFACISLLLMIFVIVLLPSLGGNSRTGLPRDIGSEANINPGNSTIDRTANRSKKFLIGFAQCNFSEPWRAEMNDQMKAAVAKYPEFELTIKDGMQDNNKQISDIESLVQKNYDLIFVSPNEAKPLQDEIEKVYNSGIPIILLDRKIDGDSYTQYIGADNFAIGKKAGEWIVREAGGKDTNVVEISGSIGTSAQIDRHNGFQDAIKDHPNIRVIDSGSSDWLREKAIPVMERMLRENKKIDIVFSHNDPSAEGAYTAAKKANREKEMKFVGIDGLSSPGGGISSVRDGRISVTYIYPSGAKESIESAYKLLVKKETLVKNLKLDTMEITQSNALDILNKLQIKIPDTVGSK